MKNLTFFLLLLLFLVACKKEDCHKPDTTVTGTVMDEQTLQPISDVTITLESIKCKRDFLGTSCGNNIAVMDYYSDNNGRFNIKFCFVKSKYVLRFKKTGYKVAGWSVDKSEENIIVKLEK